MDLTGAPLVAKGATLDPLKRVKTSGSDVQRLAGAARSGLSGLDAAAQVLGSLSGDEAIHGITALDLVKRMARLKLWTSPGGKTPQATLYAAMTREISAKGAAARFRKVSKGHFAASASAVKAVTSRKSKA